MGDSDDELDKRAMAILETTRQCWRILSDIDLPDNAIALDKLDEWLTLEALSHEPAATKERQH